MADFPSRAKQTHSGYYSGAAICSTLVLADHAQHTADTNAASHEIQLIEALLEIAQGTTHHCGVRRVDNAADFLKHAADPIGSMQLQSSRATPS
jgi:hypothetical protein